MKKYYSIGAIVALIIFIVLFGVCGLSSCNDYRLKKKEVEGCVALKYYMSDDFENAEVRHQNVKQNCDYRVWHLPQKAGYIFAGLYDGPDLANSKCYVDSEGKGLVYLTQDILLYPIFVEV